jgi:hypothetical protein
MKRRLKTLLVLVAIFLLPTLWLVVSHFLAKHALERYKAQLRAAGEKLTVDELLPPRIPPEQNGAKLFLQFIPYLHSEGVLSSNPPPAMRGVPPNKAIIGWQQPYIVSVSAGGFGNSLITNTWNDIDLELKKAAPGLELLHQAAARPAFNLEVDYHNSAAPLTNLGSLKAAIVLLSDAGVSDLHRGDTPSAVTNVHSLLVLVDQTKDERLLISQLVRIGMAVIASSPQWELLQATNLTDPELSLLQHDWESMELVPPLENSFKMDRIYSLGEIDRLRTSNSPSASIGLENSLGARGSFSVFDYMKDLGAIGSRAASDIIWRVCWSYDDALRTLQATQVAVETVRQIKTNGFFNNALAEQDRKIKALGLHNRTNNWLRTRFNNNFLSLFDSTPFTTGRTINRLLRIESTRRVTIIAIALKRYQLRHGTLPANLSALSPEFLSEIPSDPTDGQHLIYEPNPDGTFTLYSMIWVWPQPATPEETEQYYKNLQQRTSAYK